MESTELRIGNLVLALTGETKYNEVVVNTIFGYGINSYYNEAEYVYDEIKPIPITEEWLLKFGFKQIKPNHYWFKDKNSLRFSLIDNNLHCSIGDDEYGVLYKMIKYVHELQNLYYALTNQELTI
jgi:hypothetical protein